MEINYVYQRQRKDFGRSAKQFADVPTTALHETISNPDQFVDFLMPKLQSVGVQHVSDTSEHSVSTERFELKGEGVLHVDGGWPKDVDPNEAEQTIRYRKKVEKDEDFIRAIKSMADVADACLRQNSAIDIYQDYFDGEFFDHSGKPPSAKTLTVFRDPCTPKRSVTSISWHPEGGKKVAIAYSILQFQQQPADMSLSSYVWDVSNPNYPDLELVPASALVCLEYNVKDPHLILGGCYNGLLQYWDDRKGSAPVESSPIEKSHRDPVYDLCWLQSKTGTEFASVSTDGQILWWDLRKLAEPMESAMLDKGDGVLYGGVSLEYDAAAGPTKFLVGSEHGSVLLCNRKVKSASERIGAVYPGHHGPVYALQRNPFFSKYFLTVGDWTARIWFEDLKSPIMTTKYHSSYLTDGCWSPTRPGVFFTTKSDGSLDIWDYMFKQNDPTLTIQVSDCAQNYMRVESSGKYVASGGIDGSTTLFEICSGLYQMQPNEKQTISAIFERESKREKNLELRARELRLKEKKGETKGAAAGLQDDQDEVRIKECEQEFFEMVGSSMQKDEEAAQ